MVTTSCNKLALGTVQFGLEYGVSNTHGQTALREVEDILAYAFEHGISMLDTAVSYGHAEEVIGRAVRTQTAGCDWKIVTKTPHFKAEQISSRQIDELEESFAASRRKLNGVTFYGVLIHGCDDLFKQGGAALFGSLQQLKKQGMVKKIGVSLYNSEQIDRLLDEYPVDLVQLPLNILDQRMLECGSMARLKRQGVEIHARSVFLQGLLLMEHTQVAPWFSPIRPTLEKFRHLAMEHGLTTLQLALGFVKSIPEVDQVVVGVNTLEQLREIVAGAAIHIDPSDFKTLAIRDPAFVNPINWRL